MFHSSSIVKYNCRPNIKMCSIITRICYFFKNKRNQLIDYLNDCNIREVIERMEEFAKNKLVLIYDIDEYVQQEKNIRREFWVTLAKLIVYIHIYKLFFVGFIDDIRIRLLFQDYTLLSNRNRLLFTILCISLGIISLEIPFLLQYLEMSRQLPNLKLYHLIKYRIIKYPLNSENHRKYCFELKIMSLFLYNSFFYTYLMILIIGHILTIGLYQRNGFEIFSIIGQILGNISFFFTLYYMGAYVIVLCFIWLSSTQYLKYKFEEINTKIELSLKQMNIRLLMNAIHEHNYVERLTRDINFLFSRLIFMLYYILTLTSQLFLYIAQREDTSLILRIICQLLAIWNTFLILVRNITCNQICTRAHEAYPNLFSMLVNENIRMSFKQRLKLLSFMEKLSGPQIGFYCYDLFAMNSNGFYEYITIYVSNYLLIVSLFP